MPRPCLRVAHGVSALTGQLRIGETLPAHLRHEQCEAVGVRQFVVFRRTVVVSENLFAEAVVKMKWFHRNIRATEGPLDQAPEVIHPLRVDLTVDVFLGMIDYLVNKLLTEMVIAYGGIGVDLAATVNLIQNLICKVSRFTSGMTLERTCRRSRSSTPNTAVFPT